MHTRVSQLWRAIPFCAYLFVSAPVLAQPDPMKFGKLEPGDLEMKAYSKDTSAAAVVLGEYGQSYFTYVGEDFQVNLERHVRIKILKKAGYQWANCRIGLYKNGTKGERIGELKGFTYNLENGKVVKSRLEKEAIFDEKLDEEHSVKKFTMPNVREGSVIEYVYTLKSEFWYFLPDWTFQRAIPVVWSEYRARVPEFFIFKRYSQGYEPMHVATTEEGKETFTVHYEGQHVGTNGFSGGSGRVPGGIENVEAKTTRYRWVTKDVPALREEPYITTLDDYVSKIEFELTGTKFNAIPKIFRHTWEELTTQLLESEYFGRQLNRTGFVKAEIEGIKAKFSELSDRMAAVCMFVKKTMKWDGKERLYPESTLKKAYDSRVGNSADVNLLLVAMLREVGLDANPVILSTRDHGRAPYFPLLTKFNYVIGQVALNGKTLLLDATDPFAAPDLLPLRCLNGTGRLISSKPAEVPLRNNEKYMRYFNAKLLLSPEGGLTGTVDESHGGYEGLALRKKVDKAGKDKYLEGIRKERVGWELEGYEFTNLDKAGEMLSSSCKVNIGEHSQVANQLIYLNPMLGHKTDANPFKLENRKFPVDFAAPQEETYVLTLTLPAGYQVEELPKAALVSLPDGAGRFTYNATVNGNTLQVVSKVTIKKTFFGAEEYGLLKEFYNHIVTKHAEQVVLKKNG